MQSLQNDNNKLSIAAPGSYCLVVSTMLHFCHVLLKLLLAGLVRDARLLEKVANVCLREARVLGIWVTDIRSARGLLSPLLLCAIYPYPF